MYCTIADLLSEISERDLIQLSDDEAIVNLDLGADPPAWQAQTTYSERHLILAGGGYFLSLSGGASGEVEPIWPLSCGETVSDGEVLWKRLAGSPRDVIEHAIASAASEIDGYLASRLTTPLDPVPPVIKKYAGDLAIYNLYARRSDSISDIRKQRYETAIKFLRAVSEGKIHLGSILSAEQAGSAGIALYHSEPQVMTAERLNRF